MVRPSTVLTAAGLVLGACMTEPDLAILTLRSGVDHARGDANALAMENLAYVVGDRSTGEAVAVDPSWDPAGIAAAADRAGLRVIGVIATHDHPDHVGGSLWGLPVPGVAGLPGSPPVHVHRADADRLAQRTGLPPFRVVAHDHGDELAVGGLRIRLLHTPGHSPGSACWLVEGTHLFTGDTLFVDGCGRVDLPGSEPDALFRSLHDVIRPLSDTVVVHPGHDYGGPEATLGALRRSNPFLSAPDLRSWRALMGLSPL
jgi:hydroxyacylglutathione hydrolase